MKFKITHLTTYYYQSSVSFCHNQAILRPIDNETQSVLHYSMHINPKESEKDEFVDFFGNNVTQFLVQTPHQVLEVKSSALIQKIESKKDFSKIDLSVEEAKRKLEQNSQAIICAKQFLFESELIKHLSSEIYDYAVISFEESRNIYEACLDLMSRIFHDFAFVSGVTDVDTTVEQVLKDKKGVCQDFAHFAIACIRSVGLPAKYVSGYIETLPPEGEEKLIGADASHAWFAVFIPDFGWCEFDPTNNQVPSIQHIVIGYGRDYADIVPLKGVVKGVGRNFVRVSVDIQRV